jgi:hypothetical protein
VCLRSQWSVHHLESCHLLAVQTNQSMLVEVVPWRKEKFIQSWMRSHGLSRTAAYRTRVPWFEPGCQHRSPQVNSSLFIISLTRYTFTKTTEKQRTASITKIMSLYVYFFCGYSYC